jgi:hypothetical protein
VIREVRAMRTSSPAVSAAVLLMLAAVPGSVEAQDSSAWAAFVVSSDSRVRCLDREARNLIEAAVVLSPTIARLVTALQSSDLIVGIGTQAFQKKSLKGEARIIAATPGVRHVRITIGIPGAQPALLSVLGHELQHAVEIAAAPDVRDAPTLRAHYLRIGYERANGGYYETDAALEVGRQVSAEVAASRTPRRVAGQESVPPFLEPRR